MIDVLYTFLIRFLQPTQSKPWGNVQPKIFANVSLRKEDLNKIGNITKEVRTYLEKHPDIDQKQSIVVSFNEWDSSSINMMVYCLQKLPSGKDWLEIQQSIFLEIAEIVQRSGADFAFNCTTHILHLMPMRTHSSSRSIEASLQQVPIKIAHYD